MKQSKGEEKDFGIPKKGVLNKAWAGDTFRAQLIASPKEVLMFCGADLPEGIDVEVIEDNTAKWYFVDPADPAEE